MDILLWNPTILLCRRPVAPSSSHVVMPCLVRVSPRRSIGVRFRRFSSFGNRLILTCAGGVREINESQFPQVVLKSDRPVLVEFVANWCGPCRLISPAIEAVSQEYKERLTIVKIDHDSNPRLIEEYKVYGLPTLILFKDGEEVPQSRREGAITKAKLRKYVDSLLDSISLC